MKRRGEQRGYNLVEMGIALVVFGLLLGGMLVPLQVRYETAQVDSTEAQLQEAKDAIIGYAVRNKTRLRYYQAPHDKVSYIIPEGRPYLPCPDITGNGEEDRTDLPGLRDNFEQVSLSFGVCEQQKGMLPWKTLGLEELDSWGGHLTYRVDMSFSNALTGFDENAHADILDRTKPLLAEARGPYYQERDPDNNGAIICQDLLDKVDPAGDCPSGSNNVLTGIVSDDILFLGARRIGRYAKSNRAGGILDGAVFVVLSHGRNGGGAINRNGVCRSPPVPFQINGDIYIGELANAYYRASHPFRDPALQFKCAELTPSNVSALRENLFVGGPVANATTGGEDDILVWTASDELFGALLNAGALPIQHARFLPE